MHPTSTASLNRVAFSATAHCLTGCAIGEVLGLVIGTILGWGNVATIALAVVLAFFFGYSLTMLPLLRSGLALATVLPTYEPAFLGEPGVRAGDRLRGGVPGQPLAHR